MFICLSLHHYRSFGIVPSLSVGLIGGRINLCVLELVDAAAWTETKAQQINWAEAPVAKEGGPDYVVQCFQEEHIYIIMALEFITHCPSIRPEMEGETRRNGNNK